MARNVNWEKIILAFLIAVFLFSLGLFLGYLARGILEGSTIGVAESARNEIVNLETVSLLDKGAPCTGETLNLITDKLGYIGELISTLEIKNGKFDKEVLELKKLYSILEVRHMLLIKDRSEKCGQNYSTFLFFYSNSDDCAGIDETSFILTYLRNKYDNARVYSFDVDLNSDIINILKKKYGIDSCRAVVLNDVKLTGDLESQSFLEGLVGR